MALLWVATAACGGSSGSSAAPPDDGPLPLGAPIARTEGSAIGATGWRWVPFANTVCTDAFELPSGAYEFSTSSTGLAISWGPEGSADLVVFLQGGGACWDYVTCGGAGDLGVPKTASAGPFGPAEFEQGIHDLYPASWIRRENLPPSLRDATIVFVPYCTGDVHAGDRETTYSFPGRPSITWRHAGRTNLLAFLERLGATFPSPRKLVVAGSSAGGFGSFANYTAFRRYWPDARAYLVDDSGPPLPGDAVPPGTRAGWYASWNLGAALDPFCPACADDLSQGLVELAWRYPQDRIALLSPLQDLTIRGFFGRLTLIPPSFAPMPADDFEAALRSLGASAIDPAPNARYFFTAGEGHALLLDPAAVTSPAPLEAWLELMLSDSPEWTSVADP